MARECKISSNGGQLTVQMSINNGVISGGDFSIYDFNTGLVLHSFKIQTGADGEATYPIPYPASKIQGMVLSWLVKSCSPIITDSGTLTIKIFQDGHSCPMNPPAIYTLQGVPQCSVGHALPAKGGLHFVSQLTVGV